jgi:hypothetical protein
MRSGLIRRWLLGACWFFSDSTEATGVGQGYYLVNRRQSNPNQVELEISFPIIGLVLSFPSQKTAYPLFIEHGFYLP